MCMFLIRLRHVQAWALNYEGGLFVSSRNSKPGLLQHLNLPISLLFFIGASVFSVSLYAIEIVEGEPSIITDGSLQDKKQKTGNSTTYTTSTVNQSAPPSAASELLFKIQSLEIEVQRLRGLVEEQAHLLEQLSQRRMDDYLNLDRRISALKGGEQVASTMPVSTTSRTQTNKKIKSTVPLSQANTSNTPPKVNAPPQAPQAERARLAYRSAYQKVKDRDFENAKILLIQYTNDYPESKYIPNANYWLGELYYRDNDYERSKTYFQVIVNAYPDYRKAPDAELWIGKIYHQMGEKKKAKTTLNQVITAHPESKAAIQAKEYLTTQKLN